ncbi:MAG: nucleotidyltransferase family protein [Bacteroidales bacterium]|jgi:NDP-sugar pyrophosphorylase family protein|nr:nucleotidyltransferase family protein [Bacteroidales bacterium]
MKAMIFAAGIGTRLKPLTNNTPKALIKVSGVPMLELVIKKLINTGVNEIIINVHYLADQIIDFLKSKNNFGIRIEISDETDELLDTGGGLKKASWFFNDNEPFILHNVDVISNIDLREMLNHHNNNKALATLAVRKRTSSRYFIFNKKQELSGWENTKTSEKKISKSCKSLISLAFSGIHIINPEIFKNIDENGKFSIISTYFELSKSKLISAYQHDKDYWFDIGNQEKLEKAEKYLISKIEI